MRLSEEPGPLKALGVFGRLIPDQEKYLQNLQSKYYQLSKDADAFGIFPHLTLIAAYDVPSSALAPYLDLLNELNTQLPLIIQVSNAHLIDEQNIAFGFDIGQTQEIRDIASNFFPEQAVCTDYFI